MPDQLIAGFRRFQQEHYAGEDGIMQKLARNGQKPNCMIISCADSRADPAIIFDADPGKFFGFKSIGAIVRPYSQGTALSATLAYAIGALKTDKLVLLGHTKCGAVKAMIEGIEDPDISSFVDVAQLAKQRAEISRDFATAACAGFDMQSTLEQELLHVSEENLRGYPAVQQALAENRLTIKKWLFDLEKGDLKEFNPNTGRFETLLNDVDFALCQDCGHDHTSHHIGAP
jgi:carbonic anhydrase